jgi:hypothetical protein
MNVVSWKEVPWYRRLSSRLGVIGYVGIVLTTVRIDELINVTGTDRRRELLVTFMLTPTKIIMV